MLKKANELKPNDGYIIDSLGWALFKLKKYNEAKKYLEEAVSLMTSDPVINDHYADSLWMNNNTVQARYYWNYVLKLEKTEEKLNGASYPFSMLQFLNDIMRSVAVTLRNFSLEFVLIIILLGFSLIPPLGLILPFVLFFISTYFYGFSMVDYTLERRGIGISKSIKFIRNHSGSAMSLGTPLALVLLIPFLGSMLAGFIAIVSVVAATLESVELLNQNKLEKN